MFLFFTNICYTSNMKSQEVSSMEVNFQYFLSHKKELMKKYAGKYLLIANKEVVSVSDDEFDLIRTGRKQFGGGNFCVQICGDIPTFELSPIIRLVNA